MKSKKVLTILLSMAIMLTFMPTMAFAAPGDPRHAPIDDGDTTHYVVYDEEASTAATCTSYGVNVFKCRREGCEATVSEIASPKEHKAKDNPIHLKTNEYIERVAEEQSLTEEQIEALVEQYSGTCTVFVNECEECGNLMNVVDSEAHAPKDDEPACTDVYECRYCGEMVERVPAAHTVDEWQDVVKNVCPKEKTTAGAVGGLTIQTGTCTECGEEVTRYITTVEFKRGTKTYPAGTDLATMTNRQGTQNTTDAHEYVKGQCGHTLTKATEKDVEDGLYITMSGVNYKATVKTEPTCTTQGLLVVTCPVCGFEVESKPIAIDPTAHVWSELHTPATCRADEKTTEYCSLCGIKGTETIGEKKLGHDYDVTVVAEPSCYAAGITTIACTRCGAGDGVRAFLTANQLLGEGKIVKVNEEGFVDPDAAAGEFDYYFIGFDNEFLNDATTTHSATIKDGAIKIDDWAKMTHKYGQYEEYAEATCTTGAFEAKRCEVCGNFNVHDIVEVGDALGHDTTEVEVRATCGTEGYTYKTCSRCKLYVNEDETQTSDVLVQEGRGGHDFRYDVTEPVVSLGTPCNYEWETIEEPTPTKDGLKQYKCTECGDVAAEESIPYAGSKEEEAAKDAAIEAAVSAKKAADAKVAAGNLTDDSAKAIADAKADLDAVMANGGSAELIAAKTEALEKAVAGAKTKAASKLAASAKKIKASKKKTKKFSAAKAFAVSGNAGAVSYSKVSGNKKISVANDGTVKVKKGLKKGKTYKVKVNVTDAGNGTTMGATQQVVLKVKIKK